MKRKYVRVQARRWWSFRDRREAKRVETPLDWVRIATCFGFLENWERNYPEPVFKEVQ